MKKTSHASETSQLPTHQRDYTGLEIYTFSKQLHITKSHLTKQNYRFPGRIKHITQSGL